MGELEIDTKEDPRFKWAPAYHNQISDYIGWGLYIETRTLLEGERLHIELRLMVEWPS